MNWLLAYLLAGFVMRWIAGRIVNVTTPQHWGWDLASTVLWPLAIVIGTAAAIRQRMAR